MEKRKKKGSTSKRKKRLQLDEDGGSYSQSYISSSRSSEPSTTGTNNSARSQVTAGSGIEHGTSTSLSRSSTSVSSTLTSSTANSSSTNIFQDRLGGESSTTLRESNDSNQNSEGGAAKSDPPRPRSASPEPNCAICLGLLENKSFTDSCFHQFCFVCLVEWSKVKAECPLCKQSFKSIVHNVRSYDDYDQYHIPRPEDRNLLQELTGPGSVRFRYRTTVTDHRYTTLADRINREIESRLLQRPSRSLPIPNYRRLRQPANSDFRRSVYLQRLKLNSPPTNTRRRVRETSPSFFRENPAQTHRLVPWVNRELNALLQGHGEQVAFVLDLIMGLIKRFPIDSEEFYQHVFPYIGRHTRKFMQEFLMFAKSPYHMAAYDRHSSYVQSDEPYHDSDSDSNHRAGIDSVRNDGNDSDVIVVSPGNSPVSASRNSQPPPPQREDSSLDNWESRILTAGDPYFPGFAPIRRTYRTDDLPSLNPYVGLRTDYAPTSASGWDSPTPGPSQLRLTIQDLDMPTMSTGISSQLTNSSSIGGSIWTPSSRSYSAPSSQPLPSTSSIFGNLFDSINLMPRHTPPTSQIDTSVSLRSSSLNQCPSSITMDSDSNNSDVEIVEVEKPWNERSPIRLSSGGDTDYDVMITGTTHINDPVKVEKKKKKHKKRQDERSVGHDKDRQKRRREASGERHSKKKRHRSSSRSSITFNIRPRSRTRSVSPLKLTVIRSPDYQHKKFAYKSHNDKPEDIIPYRPQYLSNRISDRSRSLFTSDSDSESHLSITSHRRSSKSKHSSIEIVEYRKKSSKSKKSKKHKKNKGSDVEISGDDLDIATHHHKHKKHKLTEDEKRRKNKTKEQISYGFHKKSKNKSKKKKHHKEKKHKEDKSKGDRKSSAGIISNKSFIYTSDSEPDSISEDNFENESEKELYDPIQSSSAFRPPGVEFVEVDAAQAAVIDQELDNINKTLANNDYINSLLKDSILDPGNKTEEVPNTDPNRMVNPNEIFNQRSFKKHPYGHKKSGKSNNSATVQGRESGLSSESLFSTVAMDRASKPEDSIQSHDITSCTDIDSDHQLPSFLTFSNLNPNFLNTFQNSSTAFSSPENRKRCPNETPSYESPTSSGLLSCRDVADKDNETVDVDGISDDSDIDITGVTVPPVADNVNSYKTSNGSIQIDTSKDNDFVGDSNEGLNYEEKDNSKSHEDLCQTVDVDGVSDDSDVDITGFTVPSEPDNVISYQTSNDSIKISTSKDIDVVGDSNEELSDEDKDNKKPQEDLYSNKEQDKNSSYENNGTNESDIDVESDDSDIECSLVEGHKTFEIEGDSESEHDGGKLIDITNVSDIDITGYSDDEIVVDADDDENEESIKSKEVKTLNLDTSSETDLDYNFDDINSALSSEDFKSESDTDRYEESESNPEAITNPVTVVDKDTDDFVAENTNNSTIEQCLDNKASTTCIEKVETYVNEDDNVNVDQELQDCQVNKEAVDKPLDVTISEQPIAGTSSSSKQGDGHTNISESSELRLAPTGNPIYEARPLSVPDIVDASRAFSSRERSTPEQEYIINLPRECDSPDTLASVSSPEVQASPDLRGSHYDEDFMPED